MAIRGKSNAWTLRVSCSSGPMHRGRTDELLARNATIPIPIFMLGFSSSGAAISGIATGARPAPPTPARLPPPEKMTRQQLGDPSEPPTEPAAVETRQADDSPAAPAQGGG